MSLGNLLLKALSAVPPSSLVYKKFLGNKRAPNGMLLPNYDEPVVISNASIQPVPTRIYQILGLDFQREYRRVFVPTSAVSLERQLSPDIFEFDGNTWRSVGNTPWHSYDGWNELIVVGDKTR